MVGALDAAALELDPRDVWIVGPPRRLDLLAVAHGPWPDAARDREPHDPAVLDRGELHPAEQDLEDALADVGLEIGEHLRGNDRRQRARLQRGHDAALPASRCRNGGIPRSSVAPF